MNKALYLSIRRWHFFAGLFVVPFILMLSLTGLVMVAGPWTDAYQYGDELTMVNERSSANGFDSSQEQGFEPISSDLQLVAVKAAYPNLKAAQYVPPINQRQSSLFKMRGQDFATTLVFVNPYSGAILGDFDSSDRWYSIADGIHGSLLLGKFGDALIEVSTGLTFFLILTGMYLYWPRNKIWLKKIDEPNKASVVKKQTLKQQALKQQIFKKLFNPAFIGRPKTESRSYWKALHGSLGVYSLLFLLFFSLSGMTWTGIWGQKLVQPYSGFPVEKRASSWQSDTTMTHGDLNDGDLNEIPWGLEQVPLPTSNTVAVNAVDINSATTQKSLDAIIQQGLQLNFTLNEYSRFRVALPLKPEGVYTLLSIASSRDVIDPREDRTVHIDQYSGLVLADIGWNDYNLGAKTMALSIPLHQATLGVWNIVLAVVACIALMLISVSGVVMWWQRKPTSPIQSSISAARAAVKLREKLLLVGCVVIAILFPVTGAAMVVFSLVEWIRRYGNDGMMKQENDRD